MTKLLVLLTLSAVAAFPVELPRKSPEFIVKVLDKEGKHKDESKDRLLSSFRGKVVVIEFFNPTCPHCQKTVAILQKLYKELGPKGFQPLAIAAGEDHVPLIPKFIEQFALTFPVGYTEREKAMPYLHISNMQSFMVPQTVFIDKQGIIREQHVGGDLKDEEAETRKKILELLSGVPAAPAKKAVAAVVTKK